MNSEELPWTHKWDKTPFRLPMSVYLQAEKALKGFLAVRTIERTWIERMYGVPSWMLRVEGVLRPDGTFCPFEVEDRPAGIGMLKKYMDPEGLKLHFEEWPDVSVVRSDSRNGIDDPSWGAPVISLEEALARGNLVLVRAPPEEERFHLLMNQSVSTIALEGDKSYGRQMGWWIEVSRSTASLKDILLLARAQALVSKPFIGTRTRGVHVYIPSHLVDLYQLQNFHDVGGWDTLKKQVMGRQGCFLQPFVLPMQFSWRPKNERGIIRIYFRYSKKLRKYVLLEGCPGFWNTRPQHVIIHGTPDSCFGPLEVE